MKSGVMSLYRKRSTYNIRFQRGRKGRRDQDTTGCLRGVGGEAETGRPPPAPSAVKYAQVVE